MTPVEALTRGGHQHPEQILADLEAGGFIILDPDEAVEYEDDQEALAGLNLKEYADLHFDYGYDHGYRKGLDVGKDRYGH